MALLLSRASVRPFAANIWGNRPITLLPNAASFSRTIVTRVVPALTSLTEWHYQHHACIGAQPCRYARTFAARQESEASADTRPKVVFLGTPEVAADVLFRLLKACQQPHTNFQIAAVVSQPGTARKPTKSGAERPPLPHPVQVLAEEWLHPDQVLMPAKASDEAFLDTLKTIQPDLCITAAYGQFLPKRFLDIPKYGTVNIHPSLLPKYRGAAPVQRALQRGNTEVGVSLLYTVRAMDSGPIIAQEAVQIDAGIQADELLLHLFAVGTQLFLDHAKSILSGEAQHTAKPQDNKLATHAPKIEKSESLLDWGLSATALHNQVRAFAPWPGTKQLFSLTPKGSSGVNQSISLKILKTTVGKAEDWQGQEETDITVTQHALHVKCADDTVLSILQLQVPGKKPVSALSFANGILQKSIISRTPALTSTESDSSETDT